MMTCFIIYLYTYETHAVCAPKVSPNADDKQLESLFATAFAMINPKVRVVDKS